MTAVDDVAPGDRCRWRTSTDDSLLSMCRCPTTASPSRPSASARRATVGLLAVRILGAADRPPGEARRAPRRARRHGARQGRQAPRPLARRGTVAGGGTAQRRRPVSWSGRPAGRFSSNAAMPSRPSGVPDAFEIASASRARCDSSVDSRLVWSSRFAAASAADACCSELRGLRLGFGGEPVVGDDGGDETPVLRLGRRQHAIGERELDGAAEADEPREEPARRAVGGEPHAGVRHHELGGFPRHHDVGGPDETDPAPARRRPARRRPPARRRAPARRWRCGADRGSHGGGRAGRHVRRTT